MKPVCRRENESVDQLIKRFRRIVNKEGILDAYRQNEFNATPSEKRRNKHAAHLKRMKKYYKRIGQI